MAEFLLVTDEVAPAAGEEPAACAAALARALSSPRNRVTILALAAPERVSALPGMARRLRAIMARSGSGEAELPLFEGRSAVSQCALYVLGAETENRGRRSAFLASAAATLVRDEICRPDVIIGWDEASALALCTAPAASARRLFFLPSGTWSGPLTEHERSELDPDDPAVAVSKGMLAGLGAIGADVVALPSPSTARAFEQSPDLSFRVSDQPVVALRLGCDETPHDPATDPALAAAFSADAPAAKAECRKALARRASLALGPRTMLLSTAPLDPARSGQALLDVLARLARADVALVVPAGGDRALCDRVNRLAIESPGKLALYPEAGSEADRQILAGSDAVLLADADDHTGRAAGLALRYGALPLAPDRGADADYLVDYDVASATGCALLYSPGDPWDGEAVVHRALGLRSNPEVWQPLTRALLGAAPRWAGTAAAVEAICLSPPPSE
jgi:hypothetical protein